MHQSNGPSNKTKVLFGLCFSASGEGKSVLLSLIRPLVSQRSLNIWSRIQRADFESFSYGECHAAMHRIRFVWSDFKSDRMVEFLQSRAEVSNSCWIWCAKCCKKGRCYQQCGRSQLMAGVLSCSFLGLLWHVWVIHRSCLGL